MGIGDEALGIFEELFSKGVTLKPNGVPLHHNVDYNLPTADPWLGETCQRACDEPDSATEDNEVHRKSGHSLCQCVWLFSGGFILMGVVVHLLPPIENPLSNLNAEKIGPILTKSPPFFYPCPKIE